MPFRMCERVGSNKKVHSSWVEYFLLNEWGTSEWMNEKRPFKCEQQKKSDFEGVKTKLPVADYSCHAIDI